MGVGMVFPGMHESKLLLDLAVILAVAGVTTLLCRVLKQPVVLGYLVAGLILGPYTPPKALVSDMENVRTWAELGVIFLMFALGLEFTFHKLRRLGLGVVGTSLVQVTGLGSLGYGAGILLGYSRTDSIFLGGLVCVSSTVVVLKTFQHLGLRSRKFAETVIGILVVEDLVAVVLLVGLAAIANAQVALGWTLVQTAVRLLLIVGSWVLVGYFFVPAFFRRAARYLDDETTTVLSVGLCLVLVAVAHKLGYSPALAAFVMGSILAETEQAERIEHLVAPLRDLFAAVFFVSVGMLVDLHALMANWQAVLLLTGVVVIGNVIFASSGAVLFGSRLRDGLLVGTSLAQIGEFSFLIAGLGESLGVTKAPLYGIAVAVSVITAFLTPYLLSSAEPLSAWLDARIPAGIQSRLLRYERWVRPLLAQSGESSGGSRALMRFFACGIGMTLAFGLAREYAAPLFRSWTATPLASRGLAWIAALIVSAPLAWGMLFAGRGRGALRASLMQLAAALWIGALSRTLLPTRLSLLATGIALLIVLFVSYRRLERGYRWAEDRIVGNLRSGPNKDSDEALFSALAPWDLHLVRVGVHPNALAVGHMLRDLDLRGRYRANLVAIRRGEVVLAPPGPEDRLLPTDDLLVLADDEGLAGIEKELGRPSALPTDRKSLSDYRLSQLAVASGHPLAGKTIRESNLRTERNAIVVGLERDGKRLINPSPDLPLAAGDVLWLVALA